METIQYSKQGSNTMYDENYDCMYWGENCKTTINNWVMHDSALSWMANIFILLVALGLVWLVAWYFLAYRRREFCVDCLEAGVNTRTKYYFDEEPVCQHHWHEREMASEEVYTC